MIDKIHMIPIDKIQTAPFNPENRTTFSALKNIKESISQVGILQPLMINFNFELIDGHRRLECARQLGFKEVPCIIRDGNLADLFNSLNTTTKPLRRADDLSIYLSGGKLTSRSKGEIEMLERILGRETLERMATMGQSASSLVNATGTLFSAIKYGGANNWRTSGDPFVKRVLLWIIENRQIFSIRVAASNRTPPEIILGFIESNQPLPR